MATTLNEKTEKMKSDFKNSAEKSKAAVKEIIDSNTKYLKQAIDFNTKGSGNGKAELYDSINDTMKYTIEKSVEFSEDAFNSLIDSYTKQMEFNVDYNSKLVDAIKESQKGHPDKLLKLIDEGFIASFDSATKNIQEIYNLYNKQLKLSMDLNQKIGKNFTTQLGSVFALQNNSMNKLTGWASEWWKPETAKVNG